MSDIHFINPLQGPGGLDRARKKEKSASDAEAKGPSFDEVLDAASRTDSPKVKPKEGAGAAPPATFLGAVSHSDPATRSAVQRLSEKFFHLIESYQKELGNPESSLKKIFPLLKNMEQYGEDMLGEISQLPETDPGRVILEEMATLLSTEAAKFHRGEYA